MKHYFTTIADVLIGDDPAFIEKLRRATTHWIRHAHATHALQRGAELTAVRGNLRHASIATTSIYLHTDDVKRVRQMAAVFGEPTRRRGWCLEIWALPWRREFLAVWRTPPSWYPSNAVRLMGPARAGPYLRWLLP